MLTQSSTRSRAEPRKKLASRAAPHVWLVEPIALTLRLRFLPERATQTPQTGIDDATDRGWPLHHHGGFAPVVVSGRAQWRKWAGGRAVGDGSVARRPAPQRSTIPGRSGTVLRGSRVAVVVPPLFRRRAARTAPHEPFRTPYDSGRTLPLRSSRRLAGRGTSAASHRRVRKSSASSSR